VRGGARRNRTADLFNAIEALSQLSYDPEPLEIARSVDLATISWAECLSSSLPAGTQHAAAV
jgi:hypothetical protein